MKKVYLIAVVFALIAGLATYMFANNLNKKAHIKDAETTSVVVALKDIPKNTMISEDMLAEDAGYFAVKSLIKEDVTPEHIGKKEELKELVTNVDIYAGEQLSKYRFVNSDDDTVGLSFKLEPDKVAYSFQASSTNGVDGFINPGDIVDIITYDTTEDGKVETKIAFKGLQVIRVSNNKDNDDAQSKDSKVAEYNSITVAVTKKQALKLYKIENTKTFKLVLNSKREAGVVGEVEGGNEEKLEEQQAQQEDNAQNAEQAEEAQA